MLEENGEKLDYPIDSSKIEKGFYPFTRKGHFGRICLYQAKTGVLEPICTAFILKLTDENVVTVPGGESRSLNTYYENCKHFKEAKREGLVFKDEGKYQVSNPEDTV